MSHTKSITLGKTLVERVKNNIDLENETQRTCINTLYLTGECDIHQKQIISSLDNKISGYKNQDIKKYIHDNATLITREELLEKLVASKLKCYYCSASVKILYSKVREPLQWTLDRIDNDNSHTKENTVVACLKCNLKRRRIDADKFYFTKNLSIKKQS
tara:strand:- start:2094 stop:2570 length:477 start_codon:yes stop_codon:yes gene_type:complete